ncbi:SDR family NAD(P)-dependent oxidoreductase [Streptomyces sp. NY05-11A]|uniref:SDR family NAD(P)-dependent oxidoreductase n=1 Tax=Streptomyces soliscabiei TaxID=588897 RepID=UPI0029B9E7CB|nr:SDR family oxidoreductase [Streptomyces sp. NY05-11A]MDX2676715.1 SDR family NAD(P)-dependent oxidoreductase [Streptomyces sp. NY05-11A]
MAAIQFDFTDTRVLVTGGSNGIGLGIAHAFRDAGADVVITGTRAAASDYEHDLDGFEYHSLTLTDNAGIDELAASLDRLDVLVNNAGQNLTHRGESDPDVFAEAVTINLTATFRLSTGCRPLLAASKLDGGAGIINVGSMSSFFGLSILPAYGAAKGGVVQLTKGLAVAWARDGIRVNAVAPGLIETNMTRPMLGQEARINRTLSRTPMRRCGTPADVAPVVLFLAGPGARYVTGQTLPIDGGYSVQG